MLGKIEGGRRRQRMRWLGSITDGWTWVWVGSGSWWWTEKPGMVHGVAKSWTWQRLNWLKWRFPGYGPLPTLWSFNCARELSWHLRVCHFTCLLRIKVLSCLPSWSHWILISLCCVFSLCHTFRSSALPLSLLLHNHLTLCCLLPSVFPSISVFSNGQLFPSDGQRIEASVSASILPMNIQGSFPLGLTGLISLLSKGLSRVFSNTTVRKHQFFRAQHFFRIQLSHS